MTRSFGGGGPVRHGDKNKLVLLVSVVLVLGCIVVALALLSGGKAPEPTAQPATVIERGADIQMVDVVVPLKEIEPGTPLEPAMFRKDKRPDVGLDQRTLHDFEEIRGQFARSLIVANQPLARDFITPVRPLNGVTASIPEGYRAVTIKVDVRTSVEGFVRAGARVDVNWISNVNGKPTLTMIVQNAKVLSVDRQVDNDAAKAAAAATPSTVTLLVTAEDSQKIQLASIEGSLSLSLRGDTDTGKTVDNGGRVNLTQLLNGSAPEQPAVANCDGTITVGGQKYCIKPGGKWEPMAE